MAFEQDDAQNQAVVDAVEDDSSPHLRSDDILVPGIGHSLQQFVYWGLSGQSQSSKRIHDQVDPEHLNGSQRRLLEDDSASEGHHYGHTVDGQLELKELSDAVENVTAVLDSCDDGAEVVIQKNDASRLLGNLGTSNAHSEPDVGLLEGGSIVGAIASHGHHVLELLQPSSEQVLVVRRRSGENSQLIGDFLELVKILDHVLHLGLLGPISWFVALFLLLFVQLGYLISIHGDLNNASCELSECFSLHDCVEVLGSLNGWRDEVGWENMGVFGDGCSSLGVVACHHSDGDACLLAVEDGFRDGFLEGVLDSGHAYHDQVLFQPFRVVCPGIRFGYLSVAEKEGPQRFVREVADGAPELLSPVLIDLCDGVSLIDVVFAAFQQYFRSPLREDEELFGPADLIDDGHSFSVGAEGNGVDGLGFPSDLFEVVA